MNTPLVISPDCCPACGQRKSYETDKVTIYLCGLRYNYIKSKREWVRNRIDGDCENAFEVAVELGEKVRELRDEVEGLNKVIEVFRNRITNEAVNEVEGESTIEDDSGVFDKFTRQDFMDALKCVSRPLV